MNISKFARAGAKTVCSALNHPAILAAVVLAAVVPSANAAFNIGTGVTQLNNTADQIKQLVITICGVAGICCVAAAFFRMKKKGGDRGEDITMGSILWLLGSGAGLMLIWLVAGGLAAFFGGTTADIGKANG